MNRLKLLLFTLACVLTVSTFGQNEERHRAHQEHQRQAGAHLEKLKTELDLSEEQVAAVTAIFEETKTKMQALRNQEFENREDRMKAAKEIREAQKESMLKVLSAEQAAKLEELRSEHTPRGRQQHGQKRAKRAGNGERAALLKEVQKYRVENIQPVMQAQRAKLETDLSMEDKATINELRAQAKTMHKARTDAFMKGERMGPPSEEQKALHKEHRDAVKALVEKYDTEISDLLKAIEPQREEWHQDLKELHEKHMEARDQEQEGKAMRSKKMKGRKGAAHTKGEHRGAGTMGKAHFLLMDPNSAEVNSFMEESPFELEAYPNPAVSTSTINYTVTNPGKINIVLRNKAGNVSRVLFSGYQQAGDHNLEINTGNLQSGTYFYTITDERGSKPVTKQLIISK